jgi:hypothetical protein
VAEPSETPDAVARIVAAALVATAAGAVITALIGRRAGFIAFLAGAAAHEVFDAPLARRLSALGL